MAGDQILPQGVVERDIAQAVELRDRWTRYLEEFQQNGAGRLRINGEWETAVEATTRLQGVVHHHARTVELLEGFRPAFRAGG